MNNISLRKTSNYFWLVLIILCTACEEEFLDTKIDTFKTPEAAASDRETLWTFGNAFYAPMTYGFSVIDNNLFAAASDEAQQTSYSANVNYFNNGTINENINPISYLYKLGKFAGKLKKLEIQYLKASIILIKSDFVRGLYSFYLNIQITCHSKN